MKATQSETTVAARVAGEDIRPGDFLTVLTEIFEIPSYVWSCSGASLPVDEPVRLRLSPYISGQPFRVVGVCLPFVYAEPGRGKVRIFDVRRHELVRLDAVIGKREWSRGNNCGKKRNKRSK